jgi:hypothetical protein
MDKHRVSPSYWTRTPLGGLRIGRLVWTLVLADWSWVVNVWKRFRKDLGAKSVATVA